jgi:hypothetical protein
MELEAPDEPVTHAERVTSERVMNDRYDVWDIHTDKGRWWVVTPLTNLYSQADFPSAENVLTFHIGLGIRVMSRHEPRTSERDRDRTAVAWRKWMQAANALDQADEAEDFQAIGMRLREAMISFVREIADDSYVEAGAEKPKAADVVNWVELIANRVCAGESASSLRSYLKKTAKAAWELVNWLTHAGNAIRTDAEIALSAVETALGSLSLAVIKFERGVPDRCPDCSSYRMTTEYRELPNDDYQYVTLCEACGWERPSEIETHSPKGLGLSGLRDSL